MREQTFELPISLQFYRLSPKPVLLNFYNQSANIVCNSIIKYDEALISQGYFIQNKIYLAISSPDDLFAPGVFTDLHNEANIEKFYERLRWLITFPEQFDLSTRVWR